MKRLLLLSLLALGLTGCFETFDVSENGYKGARFGTDTAAIHYTNGDVSFTMIKNNNSKSFKEGASVVKNLATAYGVVESAKEMTAQRASDNALKAGQAAEATKQQAILSAPTKYLPAEGEAISRAGGAVVIP